MRTCFDADRCIVIVVAVVTVTGGSTGHSFARSLGAETLGQRRLCAEHQCGALHTDALTVPDEQLDHLWRRPACRWFCLREELHPLLLSLKSQPCLRVRLHRPSQRCSLHIHSRLQLLERIAEALRLPGSARLVLQAQGFGLARCWVAEIGT